MKTENLGDYTLIYERLDDARKKTAEKYIAELKFMEQQLKKLKAQIRKTGATDNFTQGAQSMIRENPAMKSYCTLIQRYGDMQKKLVELLPEKKEATADDAGKKLAAFVAKGKK